MQLIFDVPDTIRAAALAIVFDSESGLMLGNKICDTQTCQSGKPIRCPDDQEGMAE